MRTHRNDSTNTQSSSETITSSIDTNNSQAMCPAIVKKVSSSSAPRTAYCIKPNLSTVTDRPKTKKLHVGVVAVTVRNPENRHCENLYAFHDGGAQIMFLHRSVADRLGLWGRNMCNPVKDFWWLLTSKWKARLSMSEVCGRQNIIPGPMSELLNKYHISHTLYLILWCSRNIHSFRMMTTRH